VTGWTCLGTLGMAAGLAGCAVGPDYRMPDIAVPDSFLHPVVQIAHKTAPKPSSDLSEWWRSLQDPELNSLVSRTIESNPDLEIALTRLQEARTQELVVIGESLPAGEASGGGGAGTGTNLTVSRVSDVLRSTENTANLHKLNVAGGFDAAWEIDLFGKFRRELEAATYDAEALADARSWVLVTVAADVARAYLDMRALQRELAVLRQNIGVAKGRLDFEKARFQRGITNELDVALAERYLATLHTLACTITARRSSGPHTLSAGPMSLDCSRVATRERLSGALKYSASALILAR
jgi:outer membrane protein TolC